jgi:branched-subunit amino acid transport protein
MTPDEAIPVTASVCFGVGVLAKQWRKFPDWLIPTLVAGVGAVALPSLCGWTAWNVINGFLAGISATGINQMGRQIQQRSGNTEIIKKP